jgi:hypothetical protein
MDEDFRGAEMRTPDLTMAKQTPRVRLPDGSRSVESPWVWRGFLFMSLIALGLCLTLVSGGQMLLAAAWGFITLGWLATSMWLWRRHIRAMDEPPSSPGKRGGNP